MKKLLILLLCCTGFLELKAQQDPMYTHYMDNTLGINPAYAGSRDALTVTLLHRTQWLNFPGAPTTQTVTAHAPVFNDLFSLGVSVVNDVIGPVRNSSFFVDYAYRVQLTPTSKLAFGLKFGLNAIQASLANIDVEYVGSGSMGDPAFSEDLNGQISPNLGFGVYYTNNKFYLGVSTPRLFDSNIHSSVDASIYKEQKHYFLIAGNVYPVRDELDFVPTTFVKITKGAPIEADLTGCFVYQNRFNIGAMYRTGDAIGLLTGINLSEQFYIGYSFDWSTVNSTSKYNNGSHEIVLRYDFIFTGKGKIRSPRYF